MNKICTQLLLAISACLYILTTPLASNAQCPAGRYEYNYYFSNYTMDSVTYSTPYSQKMDIYQPVGDTLAERPLIVLAHGGAFISGTREDDVTIDSLCVHFAKRGYVVASIDYRLGNALEMYLDSSVAITEVIQAISDGKAAVRYFVKDRATTNTYKIDTNNIFIGGNSAGAVLYMNAGYIDSLGACPADIQTAMLANGGFEGNSGNAGYTTRSKAIINLAGALNEVGFVMPGGKPSVNAQGSADSVVPYECGYPNVGVTISVTLCGLGQLEPRYVAEGIYHMSHVFPGQGHVPWSTDSGMFVTVDSMVQLFLYDMICTTLGTGSEKPEPALNFYPNPATEIVHFESDQPIASIKMYNQLGIIVIDKQTSGALITDIECSHFPTGLYFASIEYQDKDFSPKVIKLVVR